MAPPAKRRFPICIIVGVAAGGGAGAAVALSGGKKSTSPVPVPQGSSPPFDVVARLFDASATPVGDEFQVSTTYPANQYGVAGASDPSGNFVIVWSSDTGDGSGSSVRARRLDNTGNPYGPDFQVNTYTTGSQFEPAVGMNSSGFVVVWSSDAGQDGSSSGVFGRRYDASGSPLGGEFQINTYTAGDQRSARIAMNESGFLVVWQSAMQDGSGNGVFGQRYDVSGNAVGSEFQVNTYTMGDQFEPDAALDGGGAFVVAWTSAMQDGSTPGVFGRRFDSGGSPLGSEFLVNTFTTGSQSRPRVAMDPTGSFVITWQSLGEDDPAEAGKAGVFAQRFGSDGAPIGLEFPVNVYTTDNQQRASIAIDGRGQFYVAWESYGQNGPGSGYDIFARRGGFPDGSRMTVDEHPSSGTSNLNGVLEPGEWVAVEPAWRNRGAVVLPLSGTASNLTGPPGPAYTVHDSAADYGSIDPGGTNDCFDATGDCLEMEITGARPAMHWDATFDEALSEGVTKTWALHIGESFTDVPVSSLFYRFIENLFHNGVTGGCGGGNYCPGNSVTRAQMAVFLLKSEHGSRYVPPPCTGVFGDVPCPSQFADWIERLQAEGITGGCGGGNYCPDNPVTRQQMAAFLLKTRYGSAYVPAGCTGIFGDVACPSLFADWVEDLYNKQITGGCQASPLLYCPTNPNTRGQMAVFLVKTFGLLLYGP